MCVVSRYVDEVNHRVSRDGPVDSDEEPNWDLPHQYESPCFVNVFVNFVFSLVYRPTLIITKINVHWLSEAVMVLLHKTPKDNVIVNTELISNYWTHKKLAIFFFLFGVVVFIGHL